MRHRLTDRQGRTDPFLDDEPSGHHVLGTLDGRTLGRYDPRTDETRDWRGLQVGRGDQLARVLDAC